MTADPGSLLPLALQAVAVASDLTRTRRPTALAEKTDRDLVSDVDFSDNCDAALFTTLRRGYRPLVTTAVAKPRSLSSDASASRCAVISSVAAISFRSCLHCSFTGYSDDGHADHDSPVPEQARHGVRLRRSKARSPASPAIAGDRRRVTNFHPRPPQARQERGLAAVAHVMVWIIPAATSRGCALTVPSRAWPSRMRLVTVSLLG